MERSEETYERIKVLGHGSYGDAILYRRASDNNLVVWKEIDLRRLNDAEKKEAENEVEIMSMLKHPNITSYLNHFIDGDRTLLIEMEYVDGGTLYHALGHYQQLIPESIVSWFLVQLVNAVAYVHGLSILHRDIKTMNVFLMKSTLVKLGDFGISKLLGNTEKFADTFVGTPYYLSPELVKGERYNDKSDMWAIGIILYELLTLRKPFDATNKLRLASDIVKGADVDAQVNHGIYSHDIIDLTKNLLAQNPEDRPSAEAVLNYPHFSNILRHMSGELAGPQLTS